MCLQESVGSCMTGAGIWFGSLPTVSQTVASACWTPAGLPFGTCSVHYFIAQNL